MALRKDPGTRFADGNEFTNAISAVRQGQRPPQPKSAALAPIADEPSPSASTEMLANMAHPTTVRPAVQPSTPQPKERPAKQGGFGTGLLIAVAIAALVAIGLMAYRMWGNTTPTPPPAPTEVIVTETVEPETPEEEETEAPETVEITTVEEEPTRVTVTTTHSVIPAPPVTTEHTTHQEPPEFPTEETQPQVNDSPTPAPELDSQSNPTEESALQGGQ